MTRGKTALLAAALAAGLAGWSCDSVIYDGEGDCGVSYTLRFRYDMNMKFADAFAHEVGSVSVWAFDPSTGLLAWQRSESGAALAEEGYGMTLDVPAGDYDLVAWCGLDSDARTDGTRADTEEGTFAVPDLTVGESTAADLTCPRHHGEA